MPCHTLLLVALHVACTVDVVSKPTPTTAELLAEISILKQRCTDTALELASLQRERSYPYVSSEKPSGSLVGKNEAALAKYRRLTVTGDKHDQAGGHSIDCADTACISEEDVVAIRELMPQFLLSLAIIMLLVSYMFFLIITKWKDADVRRCIFQMIVTTVSIFCAVVINKLFFDLFVFQVIPCAPFYHVDPKFMPTASQKCGKAPAHASICVAFILYVVYHVVFEVLITKARPLGWNQGKVLFIAANFGAHLKGFAVIATFGVVQKEYMSTSFGQASALVFATWIFFVIVRWASWSMPYVGRKAVIASDHKLAKKMDYIQVEQEDQGGCSEQEDATELNELTDCEDDSDAFCISSFINDYIQIEDEDEGGEDGPEQPEWSEQMEEFEDDSVALCIGFLLMQLVCLRVLGEMGSVEEEHDRLVVQEHREQFKVWELFFLLLLILIIILRSIFLPLYIKSCPKWFARFVKTQQCITGMALCWLLFRHGVWFWLNMFNDLFNPSTSHAQPHALQKLDHIHLMATMMNACAWSVACVWFVIFIDLLADFYESGCNRDAGKRTLTKFKQSLNPGFPCCGSDRRQEDMNEFENIVADTSKLESKKMNPIRNLNSALAFLVGICWERAFSEANFIFTESFIEFAHIMGKTPLRIEHKVVGPSLRLVSQYPMSARFLSGLIIVSAVFLTWVKYLVPYARMSEIEHIYLQLTEDFASRGFKNREKRTEVMRKCLKAEGFLSDEF